MANAWASFETKDFDAALAHAAQCRELYEPEALRQQKMLSSLLPATERDKIFAHSTLNDVAASYLVAAQVHDQRGDTPTAIALYQTLSEKFPYAQCWDPRGWFWRPAAVGRSRLFHLEFEAAAR